MRKVLVVDDTKNIRNLLTTCLEGYGYDVLTASDGRQAYNLLITGKFDLVFLDVKLPEMSGTEVLRNIRAAGITIPVVIMTAFATVKNAVECTKLGAVAYLQKPFTADKVRNVLSELQSIYLAVPNDINYLINASKELINENKLDEAFGQLKEGLSIDPTLGEIYYLIGTIYEKQGDTIQSVRFYEIANKFGFEP